MILQDHDYQNWIFKIIFWSRAKEYSQFNFISNYVGGKEDFRKVTLKEDRSNKSPTQIDIFLLRLLYIIYKE